MKQLLHTLFTFLFLLTLSSYASAQSGLITGKVVDREQNFSMPGATLRLGGTNRYTISKETGNFEFLNVPAGSYDLTVSYIGYKEFKTTVTVIAGKATDIRVVLETGGIMGKAVVIMGDRMKGQARALNQQKNNPNISNIISADQVGRFPDANIGDALKRVPGVTMQNDQGEARDIIIRGIAPELNSVSLNGDRIPSAEGDNRRVQMDLIPSDMIQTIEVNKTLTPDMDADAIGGSVNLITRAAPNGLRISGALSSGYNPIREKALYTGSFIAGNRFLNNRLGVVLSASYNNNDYGSDDAEATWKNDNGKIYTSEIQVRQYYVQRIRRSISVATDFKINAKNTLTFNGIYNWRDDRENRFALKYKKITPVTSGGYTANIDRETKGGIDNNRNKSRRLEDQRVKNFSLRGDHLIGAKVDLDWALSYSDARELRPNERYLNYSASKQPIGLDISDPERPFATTASPLSAYEFDELTENRNYTKEKETGARFNLRLPFSVIEGEKGRLRLGGRLRLKDKVRENNFFAYEPTATTEAGMATLDLVPQRYFNGADFQPGAQYVPGAFADQHYLGGLTLNSTTNFTSEDKPAEYAAVNYNAKETITAGYVRWDQDFNSKLSMIVGARLENTHVKYTGNFVEDEDTVLGKRTDKNNYLNVLPSLTFKYSPERDLVLRLAATTSIARPNYYDLVPYTDSRPSDQELYVGNGNLKSSYAWNFDFMAEKYFRSVGILSGGVFYKSINNFIYRYMNANYTASDYTAEFGATATNPIAAGDVWTYTQRRNGDAVQIYGFEVAIQRQLDFLPGFLKNFGVYANYTYTGSKTKGVFNDDGEERTDVKFPGTPPNLFNLSLSYETKRFSSRLSSNFAGAYVYEIGGSSFDDSYYDKQFFLDANASYKFSKRMRLFAEANNLTNQPLRFYQGEKERTMQVEFYRPRYNLGLKFDL